MARIDAYFRYLREAGASDLHLSTGRPPMLRQSGHVTPIPDQPVLDDATLRSLLREIVSERQWQRFTREHDLDFATSVAGLARFRGNYFEQEHGVGAVFRMVPDQIIPIEQLGVPDVVHRIAELQSGMVLVTGPTGSGKSTTLAAIIDLINRNHARHIVTIEDPVEFVHSNKQSVISHREVGTDSDDFTSALRAALRQDADVVLVGEMRDLETISLAVEAASMGVLVFGTLHTNSAAKTVDRIIDTFPKDQQDQARAALADSLAAVVAQILVRKQAGGRAGVHEILMKTSGLSGAIREGNTAMINSIITSGRALGMQTMDSALMALVQNGVIDGHEAYLKASDKKPFARWASAEG
jgi:twitching motility protein PilT